MRALLKLGLPLTFMVASTMVVAIEETNQASAVDCTTTAQALAMDSEVNKHLSAQDGVIELEYMYEGMTADAAQSFGVKDPECGELEWIRPMMTGVLEQYEQGLKADCRWMTTDLADGTDDSLRGGTINMDGRTDFLATWCPPVEGISVDSSGNLSAIAGNFGHGDGGQLATSTDPAVSPSGRYVSLSSTAADLVSGDANAAADVFVRDRWRKTTSLVSRTVGGASSGNAASAGPTDISNDGRYVVFSSQATDLVSGDTNARQDVFLRDMWTGVTTRLSIPSGGGQATAVSGPEVRISSDGRYVVFGSTAALTTDDENIFEDIYRLDRSTATLTLVSVPDDSLCLDCTTTAEQSATSRRPVTDGASSVAAVSDDGRYVAFVSSATNLVPSDLNSAPDVFVRDLVKGTTIKGSLSSGGVDSPTGVNQEVDLSSNGRYVVFSSDSPVFANGDVNLASDVFLRDLTSGTTTLVSVTGAGVTGNRRSFDPAISPDAKFVAFSSEATDLVGGDTNGFGDVFVRNLGSRTTALRSVRASGGTTNGSSTNPAISNQEDVVAFASTAANLVERDGSPSKDIFAWVERGFDDPAPVAGPWTYGIGDRAALPANVAIGIAIMGFEAGQRYTVTVEGTYNYDTASIGSDGSPNRRADAECSIDKAGDLVRGGIWLANRSGASDDPLDVRIEIAGVATPVTWTPTAPYPLASLEGEAACSSTRTYTATVIPTKDLLRLFIRDTSYSNNSGELYVTAVPS